MKKRELIRQNENLEGYLATCQHLNERLDDELDEQRQKIVCLTDDLEQVKGELAFYALAYQTAAGRLWAHTKGEKPDVEAFSQQFLEQVAKEMIEPF